MPVPGPASGALFDHADLSDWLGKPVTEARAVVVERVVWGWLKPVLGLIERPSAGTSEEVFSWAIELGAIAHENPAGHSSRQLGTKQQAFSAERRAEILTEARQGSSGVAVDDPQGSFPPAPAYPDPAVPTAARW